jgi:hypothetical protein
MVLEERKAESRACIWFLKEPSLGGVRPKWLQAAAGSRRQSALRPNITQQHNGDRS